MMQKIVKRETNLFRAVVLCPIRRDRMKYNILSHLFGRIENIKPRRANLFEEK